MRPFECKEARKRLGRYLDGELAKRECEALEEHLSGCPRCLRELEELRGADQLFEQAAGGDPGEAYWQSFLPRLRAKRAREEREEARTRWWWIGRLRWTPSLGTAVAGAAVAALALVVFFVHQQPLGPRMGRAPSAVRGFRVPEETVVPPEMGPGAELALSEEAAPLPKKAVGIEAESEAETRAPSVPAVPSVSPHEMRASAVAELTEEDLGLSEPREVVLVPPTPVEVPAGAEEDGMAGAGAYADGLSPPVSSPTAPRAKGEGGERDEAPEGALAERHFRAVFSVEDAGDVLGRSLSLRVVSEPEARAREALDLLARLEEEALETGEEPDYSPVIPLLEEASRADLPDSLARAVEEALERVGDAAPGGETTE